MGPKISTVVSGIAGTVKLTVFGASGKVGRQVVALALEHGYEVVAFVHSHDPFTPQEKLKVIKGDIRDRAAVAAALAGSTAAISALGSWGTKDKDVVSTGMRSIIPAMEQLGITRLVTLTGAGALWSGDTPGLMTRSSHALMGMAASKILRDSEEHLRLLDASRLDWTCLRSPVMRSHGRPMYRLDKQIPLPWASIPRAAVARALVNELKNLDWTRSAPFLHAK